MKVLYRYLMIFLYRPMKTNMTQTSNYDQGLIAFEEGNYIKAVRLLEEASRKEPKNPMLLSKLGNSLRRVGRFQEASVVHEELVRIYPYEPEALSELATVFLAWGKIDRAVEQFEKAVRLCPASAELHYNLAVAEQHAGRTERAIKSYRTALSINPSHARGWSNLGICLKSLKEMDEALTCQRRAVSLSPNDPELQWNLALTQLLLGDLKGGFERYEWRRKIPGFVNPGGIPWTGAPARNRTLTVYAEQGLGDTLQFARYLSAAKKRAARLLFMCRKELVPLLREGFKDADEIIPLGAVPKHELSAPLMSLPHLLGMPEPLPKKAPYLTADEKRIAYWKPRLRTQRRIHVGAAWQGNPSHRDDRRRSIPVHLLIPILNLDEARFLSLQKKHGTEALREAKDRFNIVDLGDALDKDGAFTDTAAIMKCMDIVLTVDTAVAHLAGALGVEVWTMLPFVPDFRWGLKDCRFYPTMRLFRQTRRNDWSNVIEEVRSALIQRCRAAEVVS